MKFTKRLTAALLSLMILLSACGTTTQNETVEQTTTQEQTTAQEQTQELEVVDSKEIVLIDQAGREITLEQPAETIVSCYYITTYATIALGLSDKVVGLEKKAETRPIYEMAAPELLEREQVGTLKEFSVETTASLNPELVIMPVKLVEYADTLTELGINVLVVDPETQEGLEQMLILIGEATGTEERANALIEYYNDTYAELDVLLAGQENPTVYMGGNSSYLETATGLMYQNALIENAGGINVGEDIEDDYWATVSYESLISMNPDTIIIPSGASYSIDDIMQDVQLADLSAVQNDMVYQMPKGIEEWDSPIPSGILGVLWLANTLHSDIYSDSDFEIAVVEFYENFYDFEIDTTILN